MDAVHFAINDAQVARALEQFPAEMRKVAESALLEGLGELEGEVVRDTPVAHGILAGSVFSALEETGDESIARGIVAVNPPGDVYALPVETGRKAGKQPPIEAIMYWLESPKMAAAVDQLAAKISAKRRVRSIDANDERDQAKRSLAFAIAKKIAAEGTKGAQMFQRAFDSRQEAVVAHITSRIETSAAAAFGAGQ